MSEPRLYEVTWQDQDDYISDLGLERIGELIEKLPSDSFDVPSIQAHQKSVTATFKFDTVGPIEQADTLEACCRALTVVRTLYANLVAARQAMSASSGAS